MFACSVLPALLAVSGLFTGAKALSPDSISSSDREYWCTSQITQCPLLCAQFKGGSMETTSNECDPDTLVFSCVCDNNKSPNASEYSLTIPYFICTEENNQCVTACGNHNNECSNNCRTKNPCGAQSPKKVNATETKSSESKPTGKDGDEDESGADFGGSNSGTKGRSGKDDDEGSASAIVVGLGQKYGTAVLVSAGLLSFGLLL